NLLRLQGSHETTQGVLYLVEDKTRDVKLRQELIDANAAKDQFLALLSHELRNPLSPVIAMVGELEATIPDSPRVREALEVIRRNVELEARLIDDLLDITRIAKGKLQLSFETICVHQILQRAYEICREDITAKDLKVEFRLRAADAHGGKIRVESPGKDRGSTFSLELTTVPSPVSGDGDGDCARKDRRAAFETEVELPRYRRVLVVDDHLDTCTGLKRMLERRGYHITVAHTAQQAVEKVRTQEFDLLISDIVLPAG